VNHGAHSKLNNISGNNVWIKALEEDVYERITLFTDICLAASIACQVVVSSLDVKSLDRYGRKFQGFCSSLVHPKADFDHSSEGAYGQIFRVLMFIAFPTDNETI
jgi:hypothetical protein